LRALVNVAEVSNAFEVVFVCTGNRFRSPIAAATFAAETADLPVRVRSFGTLELDGAPALEQAVRLSNAAGLDLTGHRTRCLDDVRLGDVDLVIGFELNHIARAVVDAEARRDRTFLLREIVEILESTFEPVDAADPPAHARELVRLADERRSRLRVPALPIDDPYGRPAAEYERAALDVGDLSRRLATALFPSS